jgi:hypothetical protein
MIDTKCKFQTERRVELTGNVVENILQINFSEQGSNEHTNAGNDGKRVEGVERAAYLLSGQRASPLRHL